MWELRKAREEDAGELSEVAERIFYDTFGPSNTRADMDLYCAEAFTPSVMVEAMRDPGTDIIIAVHENRPIAYAQLHRGEAHPAVNGSAPIELKRFYVLEAWHGTGLAGALLGEVAARSLEHGADTIWLGVWEHNARAIRFYRKHGFGEVAEQPFMLGNDLQRDLVMAAPVERVAGTSGNALTRAAGGE